MKTRIFGAFIVLTILAVLYVLTTDNSQGTVGSPTQSFPAPNAADNDFKNLKIN